jgi:translocation and assembly module TamB
MKRRHLVVLVSVVTLLTVIFVMAVIVGVGVGTDPGRAQIRALIESQLAGRVHGKLHIGKVRGNILTGFTLDTFAIRGPDDSLLISTGRISLDYDPRDLIDRRILLHNVQVEHPYLRLRQYEKGDWNFQRIFRSKKVNTPEVPGRSFGDFVIMDSVRVRDAQVVLTRPWSPDDSLRGAKRDSAIRVNLASTTREIRRAPEGYTHTYRWTNATAFLPHIRIAHPDSTRFGQEFVIGSMRVDEQEPPFSFRSARGVVRKLGDSVFVNVPHFALPASRGSALAKIWWGSGLPIRLDIRIKGDSVSMSDVAWIYPTLPRTGGGRADVHIHNNRENLRAFEYAISNMDVRSTRSRMTGDMTFVVGGPVLAVRDVDLKFAPVNFDLLRTLAGGPFSADWQGDLFGYAKGPGGPLTHFVVDESDITWRDAHVAGAVSRFAGKGELDILFPAFTKFHHFDVSVATLDLRSIETLFPSFPLIHGTVMGTATLDSSWLDVRFSNANVTHRFGPGEPNHVTGSGRVTYGETFMTYDVNVNAQPVSLTMLSRAYPLGLKGLLSGPVQVKGTTDSMQLSLDLTGPAGRLTYNGTVDAYPLSVAAHGAGRIERLDLSQLVGQLQAPPASLTGNYQLDVRGDTNDLRTLAGNATLLLERSEFDGLRLFPSRLRARFANGRMYVDTLRIESVAGVLGAGGAIGLGPGVIDSLRYQLTVDSLGGLRRYISPFLSSWSQPATVATVDSLAGTLAVAGVVRGSLDRFDVFGRLTGSSVYVRREAGKEIAGTFAITDILNGARGSASLRIDKLTVAGIAMDTLGGAVRFDAPGRGVFSFGGLGATGVTIAARGELAIQDSTASVVVRDFGLTTDSSRWALAGPSVMLTRGKGIAIDSLVLVNGHGGRIALEGSVPDSGKARFIFAADSVPLRDVGRVLQLPTAMSGWAHLAAQGAGTNAAPVVNLQSTLSDVRYGGAHIQHVNATVEYLAKRAQVAVDLASAGRTALIARASLPIELKYFGARLLDDSLRGTIRTDSASFDIVEALIPGLRDATGKMAANLAIAGTWKHPDLAGQLRVDNGEVTVDALGIRMKGVNVDVALFGHNDSLAIRRFVGWSGANSADSLSLRGYVAYRDLEDPYVSLTLNARTFHAMDRRSLAKLDVSTARDGIRLRGRLHGATLTGGLLVDRGTIFLPDPELARKQVVDLTSQFVDTSTAVRQLLPAPPSKLLESLIIDGVRVTLGDEVWLRSREANVKLGGSLNVQRSARSRRGTILGVGTPTGSDSLGLAFEGVLRAERGTYTLSLGLVQREFQVEGGTITFYPNPEIAPELNISALHTVHVVRSENKADLRIRVRLTGPLFPNPILSLESAESFALSQSDLVSYLIFGQPNFELGNESQSYVQLAAQTLFPSLQTVATSTLRGVLGPWADIFQLRPGSSDPSAVATAGTRTAALQDAFWTSRLGAEKQLSDNVFVSLSTGICQFNSKSEQNSSSQWLDFYNGLSGKIEWRLSGTASVKAGKEPSAQVCNGRTMARLVPTPSQWGLSLFKSWRF